MLLAEIHGKRLPAADLPPAQADTSSLVRSFAARGLCVTQPICEKTRLQARRLNSGRKAAPPKSATPLWMVSAPVAAGTASPFSSM